jgi:hypothetical protein
MANSLTRQKITTVSIVGYGSPSGGTELNQHLSLLRARVVAQELGSLLRTRGDVIVGFLVRGGGIRRLLDVANDQIAIVAG